MPCARPLNLLRLRARRQTTSTPCLPLLMQIPQTPWTEYATRQTSRLKMNRTGYFATWRQCRAIDLPLDLDSANLFATVDAYKFIASNQPQSRAIITVPLRAN